MEQLPVKQQMTHKGKGYLIEIPKPGESKDAPHGYIAVYITKLFRSPGRWTSTGWTVLIPEHTLINGLNVPVLIDGL
jgi:hypothetical protein